MSKLFRAALTPLLGMDGRPIAGFVWASVENGTLQPTYKDADGTQPNDNPIPLNSMGLPNDPVFLLPGAYTLTRTDASGTQIGAPERQVFGIPQSQPLDWTPTIGGMVVPGAQDYSARAARAWLAGGMAFFRAYFTVRTKDPATAGRLRISGLPWAAAPGAMAYYPITVGPYRFALAAGMSQVSGYVLPGTNIIELMQSSAGGAPDNYLDAASLVDGSELMIAGFYEPA